MHPSFFNALDLFSQHFIFLFPVVRDDDPKLVTVELVKSHVSPHRIHSWYFFPQTWVVLRVECIGNIYFIHGYHVGYIICPVQV